MQVLSSLSGITFYAPSAGFAPTNSADVSAIASAYAESAASSKLDSTASSSFYPSNNPSGFISGVDLSDYATTAYVDSSVSGKLDTTAQVVTSIGVAAGALSSINGYGLSAGTANSAGTATVWRGASSKLDASAASDFALTAQLEDYIEKTASSQFLTAVPEGYATKQYVDSSISGFAYESAVSGWTAKQDALTFAYDDNKISAINGSALAGQGGGGAQVVTATGSASATSVSGFWPVVTATSYLISSINGSALLSYGYSALSAYSADWTSTRTTVFNNSANWNSVYNTVSSNSASWTGSTGGGSVTSPSGTIVVINGNEIEGTNSAVLTANGGEGFETLISPANGYLGTYMGILSYANVPGTGATLFIPLQQTAHSDIRVVLSGDGENGLLASASGTIPIGTLIASVPMGGITGDLSASAEEWLSLSGGAPLTAKKDGGIVVTGVGELAWKSAVDGVTNTVAANSASWGQGGGVDSATVSAIASSYAESAASSKLDTTAFSTVSGTFLTAHQNITASANWDSTYNTVSTNSASWGQGGGGGAAFPAEIKTGDTLKAVITTGFQDNTSTRPTLFISSDPSQQKSYPRMLLSENHTDTAQSKSAAFLADAFEFYTGAGSKVFRADKTSISASGQFDLASAVVSGGNLNNRWGLNKWGVSGRYLSNEWNLDMLGVSGISGTSTWQYTTVEYKILQSLSAWATANGWTGA